MTKARQVIESLFAAFGRGDIDSILNLVADDCPWRGTLAAELPYAGDLKGKAGAKTFFDAMLGALEPTRVEMERWVCEGDDVVAIGAWAGKARSTGKSFHSNLALYFRVRNGQIVEFRGHEDTGVTAAAFRK